MWSSNNFLSEIKEISFLLFPIFSGKTCEARFFCIMFVSKKYYLNESSFTIRDLQALPYRKDTHSADLFFSVFSKHLKKWGTKKRPTVILWFVHNQLRAAPTLFLNTLFADNAITKLTDKRMLHVFVKKKKVIWEENASQLTAISECSNLIRQ